MLFLEIVKHFPKQASSEDILQALAFPVPKRSLQRYLAVLTKQRYLNALGKARSRRYSLKENKKNFTYSLSWSFNITRFSSS